VQELAAAGLSRRMLTQIELGQANPRWSPSTGWPAPSARLRLRYSRRLTRAERHQRPGFRCGVWSSAAGSNAALQVATQQQPPAELWEWTLQPGDRYVAQPDPAGSEELFLVLAETLTIDVDGLEPVTIDTGGSARLASDWHYAYVNRGNEPTRIARVAQLAQSMFGYNERL